MAGETFLPLRELLAPEVHIVFVGIKPSLTSVKTGHYYQGRLGRQLWPCWQEAGIGHLATRDTCREDLTMLRQGFGFRERMRRSTSVRELRTREGKLGTISLIQRLQQLKYQPRIVLVYRSVAEHAKEVLQQQGWPPFTLGYVQQQFRLKRFQELALWLDDHARSLSHRPY